MDTRDKLSPTTIYLHWLVAVLMILMTALGLFMEDLESQFLFDTHTTFGWIVLIVILPRVIWRMKNGWPDAVGNYSEIEHLSSKVMHWVLILATLLMPLSGILLSVANGHGLAFYSFELIPENPDPNTVGEVLPLAPGLGEFGSLIHGFVGEILPYAIALHVVGALKHHLIDKDETLRRMLGMKTR